MKWTIAFVLAIVILLGWAAIKGVGSYDDAIKSSKPSEIRQEEISRGDINPNQPKADAEVDPSQTSNPLASMINDAFKAGTQNSTVIQVCKHDGQIKPSLEGEGC